MVAIKYALGAYYGPHVLVRRAEHVEGFMAGLTGIKFYYGERQCV